MICVAKRWICVMLPIGYNLLCTPAARGQTLQELSEQLRLLEPTFVEITLPRGTDCIAPARDFATLLGTLRDEENFQRRPRGKAALNFKGDEAGQQEKYTAGVELALRVGSYPGEFKFNADLAVDFQDGELSEDVSALKIAYDYYTNESLELFAFAERFKDSFLSIDQRYEVGVGFFFGGVGGLTPDGDTMNDKLALGTPDAARNDDLTSEGRRGKYVQCYAQVRESSQTLSDSLNINREGILRQDEHIDEALLSLREIRDRRSEAVRNRFFSVRYGFVVAMLAEMERTTLVLDDSNKTEMGLEATQTGRWSLRPTFEWQPDDDWKLSLLPYLKLPFVPWETREVLSDNGKVNRWDVRIDAEARLDVGITGSDEGQAGKVGLTLRYRLYFDNVPPEAANPSEEDEVQVVRAERSHHIFTLGLSIGF